MVIIWLLVGFLIGYVAGYCCLGYAVKKFFGLNINELMIKALNNFTGRK